MRNQEERYVIGVIKHLQRKRKEFEAVSRDLRATHIYVTCAFLRWQQDALHMLERIFKENRCAFPHGVVDLVFHFLVQTHRHHHLDQEARSHIEAFVNEVIKRVQARGATEMQSDPSFDEYEVLLFHQDSITEHTGLVELQIHRVDAAQHGLRQLTEARPGAPAFDYVSIPLS